MTDPNLPSDESSTASLPNVTWHNRPAAACSDEQGIHLSVTELSSPTPQLHLTISAEPDDDPICTIRVGVPALNESLSRFAVLPRYAAEYMFDEVGRDVWDGWYGDEVIAEAAGYLAELYDALGESETADEYREIRDDYTESDNG